jgi:hypothetical protein
MAQTLAGILPGGYWDTDGALHRRYELAALTGRDEELLADQSERCTAEVVTEVLARGVKSIGDIAPVPEHVIRDMLVGDRQFLLLRLRQATVGDQVHGGVFCPWTDCGKRVTIDFAVSDVPVTESTDKGPLYWMELSVDAADGVEARRIGFRLPTGADQEEVAPWLSVNEAQALTMLLERCVHEGSDRVAGLSPLARAEIEECMRSAAPAVEQVIEAGCAECGRSFVVPFDVQRFFFGELRTSRELLYREVHYLAYHYHWSEPDIMSMSREKRHSYIDVLADEIDRLNDED